MNTRIAPSPTGTIHLGTIRTLYHNWLAARATGGKFLLRIDDTDLERSEQKYIDEIYQMIDFLGLDYDETFKQSERIIRYKEVADKLIQDRFAVKDNGCIRLCDSMKFRSDRITTCTWIDSITGIKKDNQDIYDYAIKQVIIKSDGTPTYNFSTVVDDIDYNIDWIIRGTDHISNTYKQAVIYRILLQNMPKFTHVGLICNKSGKKLSKRDSDAINWKSYKPEAILNYVLRLGWGPKIDDKTTNIITKERALELFVEHGNLRATNAKLDLVKLNWYNKKYKKINTMKKVAIIGSEEIYSDITRKIIKLLIPLLENCKVLTGGTGGSPYALSSFLNKNNIIHLLPIPNKNSKYHKNLIHGNVEFFGNNMNERSRELIKQADIIIMLEGGYGTAHEASIAINSNKPVYCFPITDGASNGMFFNDNTYDKVIKCNLENYKQIIKI